MHLRYHGLQEKRRSQEEEERVDIKEDVKGCAAYSAPATVYCKRHAVSLK